MNVNVRLWASIVVFLTTLFPAVGMSAERSPNEIAVAYVAVSGSYGPLWVAKDEGLFKKYGLEVSLQYLNPTVGVQALVAGEVDIYAGGTAALEAAVNGADIVYIGSILDKFVLSLFVQPEIKDVSELRGKVVGVSQPGAPTDVGAQIVLRGAGLVPDRDVKLSYLKGVPEILAALQQKIIHAGVINPPITVMARRAGLKELVDLGKLPERFPQTAFIARRSFLGSHNDPLIRFFKGYSEGVRFARENPRRAQEIIAKYTKVSDQEVNVENYKAFAPWWEMPPFVTEAGIQAALSISTTPKARLVKATDFIDNQIIKQLSDTGFFK